LCKTIVAFVILIIVFSEAIIGFLKILNLDASMPKAFSIVRRALLNLNIFLFGIFYWYNFNI